jgi:NADP-dependent 3-hydroxy acid dehydrogenase YdfG
MADSNIFFSIKEKEISTLIDANIKNYLLITKIILPIMIRIKAGKFIYLSSFRSEISTRGTAIYSACKAFGESFFKTIGQEYGRLGITSHIIRMGYFEGRLLDNLTNEKKLKILKRISTGRLGNAKDLAGAIKTAENLNYNNSGIIEINGGLDFE